MSNDKEQYNIEVCAICIQEINPKFPKKKVCLVCIPRHGDRRAFAAGRPGREPDQGQEDIQRAQRGTATVTSPTEVETNEVTQHCFHDSCVYSMIEHPLNTDNYPLNTDNDKITCPICGGSVKNLIYKKKKLTINEYEEKLEKHTDTINNFLLNFKFLLKKYINHNETNINSFNNNPRKRVFRMIFIIKELIERMIFYYGVRHGYNISIADSVLIETYDTMVELYGTYPQEYSYEFNARGELINLLNGIRANEFPTIISENTFGDIIFDNNNRIKYPNNYYDPFNYYYDPYITYKDEDNRLGYPISIKIDPTIWNSADDQKKIIPNNKIESNLKPISGRDNYIWIILKLNQLKGEIEKIKQYFSRDSIPEYNFITKKYTLFLKKLLVWFKIICKLDERGNIKRVRNNKYYFSFPNVIPSNKVLSRMLFEKWFNDVFCNETGYNSVEEVCIYTLIENIRTFLPTFLPISFFRNPKRRRLINTGTGGTRKRRRTKRKKNKRKNNLKKSYKK